MVRQTHAPVAFLRSLPPASVPSLRLWARSAEQQRAPEACLHSPHHGAISPCWRSQHGRRGAGVSSRDRAQGLSLCMSLVVGEWMQTHPRGASETLGPGARAPPGPLKSRPSSGSFPLGLALSSVSWSDPE